MSCYLQHIQSYLIIQVHDKETKAFGTVDRGEASRYGSDGQLL